MAQRMIKREHLIQQLADVSVKRGTFTLASGRTSNIYVDARLTTMSPQGLSIIGALALQEMKDAGWLVDSVGGLTLGADPVAYAIAYASADSTHPIRAFTVRKKPKEHGTGKLIEGPFYPGDHVAIIEDVITTGDSARRAIDEVKHAGGLIEGVLAVLDREEGGRMTIEDQGYRVLALCTLKEVVTSRKTSSS